MFKRNLFNSILALVGLVILISAFYFANEIPKEWSGVISGISAGMLGVGLAGVFTVTYNKRNPEMAKLKNIEVNDERNTLLRYKANNSVKNVNTWLLFALGMATIVAKLPLWITLSLVGIVLINSFLYFYFFNKYSREM